MNYSSMIANLKSEHENKNNPLNPPTPLTNIAHILQSLVINKVQEHENYLLRRHLEDERNYEDILIDEISKPPVQSSTCRGIPIPVYYKRKRLSSKCETTNNTNENAKRNVEKIVFCLRQLPEFIRYTRFNGIEDEDIHHAAEQIKYEFVQKGKYLFKQGQFSKRFYGIIRGRVSIRAKKLRGIEITNDNHIPLTHRQSYAAPCLSPQVSLTAKCAKPKKSEKFVYQFNEFDLEEEKTQFNSGMCFGEWAVIYSLPRTASAYALEDTDLFYLDKEIFDFTLSKVIIKSDLEKRNFVTKKIPELKNLGRIQEVIGKMIPMFYDHGDIVYTDFDRAEHLYVIYQGECCLKKLLYSKSREETYDKKEQMKTLYKVDRGGLVGLEVCLNMITTSTEIKTSNSCYQCTLVADKQCTVLYKISLALLQEFFNDPVIFLMPMYKIQSSRINSLIQRITIQRKKSNSLNSLQFNSHNLGNFTSTLPNNVSEYADKVIQEVSAKKKLFSKNERPIPMRLTITIPEDYQHLKIHKEKRTKNKNLHALELWKSKMSKNDLYRIMTLRNDLKEDDNGADPICRSRKPTLYLTERRKTTKNETGYLGLETEPGLSHRLTFKIPSNDKEKEYATEAIKKMQHKPCNSEFLITENSCSRDLTRTLRNWKEDKAKRLVKYNSGNYNLPLISIQ